MVSFLYTSMCLLVSPLHTIRCTIRPDFWNDSPSVLLRAATPASAALSLAALLEHGYYRFEQQTQMGLFFQSPAVMDSSLCSHRTWMLCVCVCCCTYQYGREGDSPPAAHSANPPFLIIWPIYLILTSKLAGSKVVSSKPSEFEKSESLQC